MAGPYFLFLLILTALCSGTRAHTAATNSTSVESRARRSTANATTDDRNLEQRPNFTQASCTLPASKGNCSENIERYFFTEGQCKPFNYSGCKGNSNRFSTIEDCMAACGDPCTAPVSTVSCPKSPSIRGFYYDQAMDTCLQFETGRCGGSNINNFQSKEECEHRCVKDACELKPQPVPCKDRTNNTYYDTKTHSCRNVDDGCLGNANSFASVQDCQDRCMMKNHTCSLPLDQGRPCAPNVRYFYYDVKSKKCKSEEQCDVTGNTFLTHSQCSWTCEKNACVQGWAPSSCDASVSRYFYNMTTRECETLHSGKCSSNMNNFESKDQCQVKCSSNDICKLSMSSGSCNGSEPRWYFKNETGQCEKFSYGGCEGNDNNFLSEAICEKACIQNPCQSPKDPVPCGTPQQNYYYDSKLGKCFFTNVTCFDKGNSFLTLEQCNRTCKTDNPCLATVKISCKTTHTHYYYDTRSGQCTRFNYTGCGGNTNNYKSLEDCKKVCKNKHKTIIDDGSTLSGERESNFNPTLESDEPTIGPERNGYRCILPLEVGSCNKTLKRFYFNSSTHSCRQFNYSDCQGNANNFLTMKACTKTCMDICHAPVEMRSCNVTVTRYHYNSTSGMCEQLPYNRCSNSLNNFQELDTCEKICVTDVCIQRKKTGPCKRYLKRFYYDPKSDHCLPFIYGGCHQNGNNFLSHEDCQRQCFHLNPCVAPAKIETSCNEASKFTRFHYNRMKGVCEKHFRCTAGGFKSLSSCEAKCSVNVCILPSEHGPCDLDRERYYYSQESRKCRPFLYGGCHGNTNNFGTLEGCVSRCEPDRCTQPKQVGFCDQNFKRYFYDSKTNSCHRFIYSGCGGNSNNFPTVTSCQNSCGTQKCDQSLDNGTACSVCELKPEEIDCAHSSRRLHFYYNSSAGRCMNFEMGKCGSDNGNSFSSLDECGKKCVVNVCQLPPLPTSCSAKSDGNVYYDMKTDTCKSFGTGICGANRNSFSDFRQCESKCVKDICHLTNDVGPCKAAVKRIFYNRLTGNCEVFQYGGCGGNKNNFVIRQDCENRCMKDPCKLSKDPGRCSAYFPQYYYNSEDNRCHSFIYGGCGGNQNRFETIDACLQRCQPNICNLPPDTGPCRAFLPRFYYNTALGKCNNFIYGGCKGNANNFKTIKNCEATCLKDPCDQPFKVGPCEARIERFYFNSMTGKCERFYYGGCDANENNFKTVEECQKRCARDPCSLPPDAGTCHHKLTHFYFDLATGRCLNFIYSGCGGNANRFLSVKKCAQICIQNRCKKEMDPGRCDKKLTRFFYDSKRGQCVSFIYGGCGGNTNNFQSAKLCKDVCLNENPCLQPKMPGPCRGSFKRFYYDSVEGKCSVFYYGGCDGNRNNFHTLSTCQNTCATERTNGISKCHLPKDQGSCSSQEQRFFYNPTLQSCEPFTYTGCAGNANNFLSERQCERECKIDPCKQPRIAGSCSRSEKRWYFDETSQLCRAFNYSGCGANANNFQWLEDCEQQCVKPTCRPEMVIGSCNQNLPRFYYNWKHGRCYQFNYTGCYGNENRFLTMKHCQETCTIDPCLQPLFITGYCSGRKKYFYNREYGICQAFIFKGCQANGNIFASSEECHKSCQHMYEIDLGRLRNTSFRQN